MRGSIKTVAAFVVLAILNPALADGPYMGVSISQVDYDEVGVATAKPKVLSVKIGNALTPNFAVEGRIGIGVSDDTVEVFGVPVDVEIDNYYGAYGRGILPMSEAVSVYGLVGFTRGKISASVGSIGVFGTDSSASFGVGADVSVSRTSSINVEWAKLLDESEYEVTTLSIGVNFDL